MPLSILPFPARPKILAGRAERASTSRSKLIWFFFTAMSIKGSMVSTPGTPAGASQMSSLFSSGRCGA